MGLQNGILPLMSQTYQREIFKMGCCRFHVSAQNWTLTQQTGSSNPKSVPEVMKDTLNTVRINTTNKIYDFMANYEEFIGIKQVKEAHARVLEAEDKFVQLQDRRRNAHTDLGELQHTLRELRAVIDRTPRGNEKYLDLITREIDLTRNEKEFREKFEDVEKREREAFHALSSALRFGHEKERAQNEKTKYWSVFGSLVGACVGIVGANISSYLKIRQIKAVVTENAEDSVIEFKNKIASSFDDLINQVAKAKGLDSANSSIHSDSNVDSELLTTVSAISKQMEDLSKRLQEIELTKGSEEQGNLVPYESKNDRGLVYLVINSVMVGSLVVAVLVNKFFSPGS